jgi:hypothetical protein
LTDIINSIHIPHCKALYSGANFSHPQKDIILCAGVSLSHTEIFGAQPKCCHKTCVKTKHKIHKERTLLFYFLFPVAEKLIFCPEIMIISREGTQHFCIFPDRLAIAIKHYTHPFWIKKIEPFRLYSLSPARFSIHFADERGARERERQILLPTFGVRFLSLALATQTYTHKLPAQPAEEFGANPKVYDPQKSI